MRWNELIVAKCKAAVQPLNNTALEKNFKKFDETESLRLRRCYLSCFVSLFCLAFLHFYVLLFFILLSPSCLFTLHSSLHLEIKRLRD
jgi:hypothetical protein